MKSYLLLIVTVFSLNFSVCVGQGQFIYDNISDFFSNSVYELDSLRRIQLRVKQFKQFDDSLYNRPSRLIQYDELGRRIKDSQLLETDNDILYWKHIIYSWNNDGRPQNKITCKSYKDVKKENCKITSSTNFTYDSKLMLNSSIYITGDDTSKYYPNIYNYYYNNVNILDSVICKQNFQMGIRLNNKYLLDYQLLNDNQLIITKYLCTYYDNTQSLIVTDTLIEVNSFDTKHKVFIVTDYKPTTNEILNTQTYISDTTYTASKRFVFDSKSIYVDCLYLWLDSNQRIVSSLAFDYNSTDDFHTHIKKEYYSYNQLGLLERVKRYQIQDNELHEINTFYFEYDYY